MRLISYSGDTQMPIVIGLRFNRVMVHYILLHFYMWYNLYDGLMRLRSDVGAFMAKQTTKYLSLVFIIILRTCQYMYHLAATDV